MTDVYNALESFSDAALQAELLRRNCHRAPLPGEQGLFRLDEWGLRFVEVDSPPSFLDEIQA